MFPHSDSIILEEKFKKSKVFTFSCEEINKFEEIINNEKNYLEDSEPDYESIQEEFEKTKEISNNLRLYERETLNKIKELLKKAFYYKTIVDRYISLRNAKTKYNKNKFDEALIDFSIIRIKIHEVEDFFEDEGLYSIKIDNQCIVYSSLIRYKRKKEDFNIYYIYYSGSICLKIAEEELGENIKERPYSDTKKIIDEIEKDIITDNKKLKEELERQRPEEYIRINKVLEIIEEKSKLQDIDFIKYLISEYPPPSKEFEDILDIFNKSYSFEEKKTFSL